MHVNEDNSAVIIITDKCSFFFFFLMTGLCNYMYTLFLIRSMRSPHELQNIVDRIMVGHISLPDFASFFHVETLNATEISSCQLHIHFWIFQLYSWFDPWDLHIIVALKYENYRCPRFIVDRSIVAHTSLPNHPLFISIKTLFKTWKSHLSLLSVYVWIVSLYS